MESKITTIIIIIVITITKTYFIVTQCFFYILFLLEKFKLKEKP